MATSSSSPSVRQLLTELRRLGKPNTAKIYARHGVREPSVGLPFADLDRMVKRLGTQHHLVSELWKTGIHEARMLATRVADPHELAAKEIESWLQNAGNYLVTSAIATLAAKRDDALQLANRWIDSANEWRSSAGWSVLSELALRGAIGVEQAHALLSRIEGGIHDAANRARYSMNNTLIAIGGAIPAARERALAVAEAIGTVHVDHGKTGCKTPDAAPYIRRMVEHAARKSPTRRAGKVPGERSATRTPTEKRAKKRAKKKSKTAAKNTAAKNTAAKNTAAKNTAAKNTATKKTPGRRAP